jgi:dTDP-4-dehydrorhamnose reductase
MNLRIAIFGSAGQLGTDLAEIFRLDGHFDTIPLKHEQADCTDAAAVRRVLVDMRPDVVINCASYVRVDDCEARAEKAFRVNSIGALNIARACAEIDALCVYISTDYVFNGEKTLSYVESDPTQPINVYGASKLAGEFLVRQTASRWLVVRSASLFGRTGARGKGGNFIETILAKAQVGQPLSIVNDVRMSPTYTRDAAAALVELVQGGAEGIIHLVNEGACSWYEFAIRALELTGIQATTAPVLSHQYPTRARRPMNSALQSERFLVRLRSWQDALEAYLVEKGHIKSGHGRACE